MTRPLTLAQLSDPHIDMTTRTDESLTKAVEHLLELPFPIDAVLISGDLTDTGSAAEYERCKALLEPLRAPVYTVPGNHDNRERFLEAFGPQGRAPLSGFGQYVIEDYPVRLIALDTHVPGEGRGNLCGTRLHWLEARLDEAPDKPTIIFMHHPPFASGNAVIDSIGLHNAAAFTAIVRRYRNLEGIFAGHTHTLTLRRYAGTLALTCPSVMHQMLIDTSQPEQLAANIGAPHGLLHTWREETGLLSDVTAIGNAGPLRLLHDGSDWVG